MPMPSFYHGSKILKNEHIAKCFIINIFSHSTATLFSARCEPIYIYIGLHLALTETVCGIAPMTTFTNNILLPKTYISHFPVMANHLEHTIPVLFGRLCQRNHVDVCEKAFLRHLCFSKYSLYRPYLLTISYSEIVEGKLVPLAPIVMLMALFDANSLLFLLILCLLYYFPEFFVELASTEIFCAQETRICLFGKDNCRLEATNFIFMENIGTMLRKQRELKGFSQEYVAGLVGVSTSVISKIETSKTKARFDVISNICKALDMNWYDLLSPEERRSKEDCRINLNINVSSPQQLKEYLDILGKDNLQIKNLKNK